MRTCNTIASITCKPSHALQKFNDEVSNTLLTIILPSISHISYFQIKLYSLSTCLILIIHVNIFQFKEKMSKNETSIPIMGSEKSSTLDVDSTDALSVTSTNTVKCMETTDFVGFLCSPYMKVSHTEIWNLFRYVE